MPLVEPVLHADIARLTEIHQFPDGTIVETLYTHAALELLDRREHYLPIPAVALLNHFVGACEQRRRNIESKRFCGRDINNEIEFGRAHHRQVSRTIALYYANGVLYYANGVHSGLVVIVL